MSCFIDCLYENVHVAYRHRCISVCYLSPFNASINRKAVRCQNSLSVLEPPMSLEKMAATSSIVTVISLWNNAPWTPERFKVTKHWLLNPNKNPLNENLLWNTSSHATMSSGQSNHHIPCKPSQSEQLHITRRWSRSVYQELTYKPLKQE